MNVVERDAESTAPFVSLESDPAVPLAVVDIEELAIADQRDADNVLAVDLRLEMIEDVRSALARYGFNRAEMIRMLIRPHIRLD